MRPLKPMVGVVKSLGYYRRGPVGLNVLLAGISPFDPTATSAATAAASDAGFSPYQSHGLSSYNTVFRALGAEMRRREFFTLIGGTAATWSLASHAQQAGPMKRIGVLIGVADDAEGQARVRAFRQGLQDLGWVEGRNIRFDVFFAEGEAERSRRYATELISQAPDVIVCNGAAVIAALQQQTKTIPIVFAQAVDPVNSGFVDSLAHPGGNITGFTSLDYGVGTKWVEILKEIAPQVKRIAILRDPTVPAGSGQLGAIQGVASNFGVEVTALDVRDAGTIERAVSAFSQQSNGGLIVLANPASTVHLKGTS